MILTAFDVKFDEKKDEILARACRPSKSKDKKQFAGYGFKQLKTQKTKTWIKWVPRPPGRPPE